MLAPIMLLVACSPPHPDSRQAAKDAFVRAINERVLVNCDTDAVYQSGMQSLARADSNIAGDRWMDANAELLSGLQALGHKYDPRGLSADDSGLHLALADGAERQGNLRFAVTKRRDVFSGRLASYRWWACR